MPRLFKPETYNILVVTDANIFYIKLILAAALRPSLAANSICSAREEIVTNINLVNQESIETKKNFETITFNFAGKIYKLLILPKAKLDESLIQPDRIPNLDAALIIRHPGNTNPAATADVRRCKDVLTRKTTIPVGEMVLPEELSACHAKIGAALLTLQKKIATLERRGNMSEATPNSAL